MRKILGVVLSICLLCVGIAFAIENGTPVRNTTFTLYNAATGTVSHVATQSTLTYGGQGITSSSIKTFDYPMKYATCDIRQTPSTGGTVTFALVYSAGSGTWMSDSAVLISGLSQTSAVVTLTTNTTKVIPFKQVRALFTGPASTTTVVGINCDVTQ